MAKKLAFHWAWVILGIGFIDLFINYSVRLGYGVVLPEMILTLGLAEPGEAQYTMLICSPTLR